MREPRSLLAWGLAAAGLLAVPGIAAAEAPIGAFEITFGGVLHSVPMNVPSLDSPELFCAELAEGFDELELCSPEVSVDGKGKISGWLEYAGSRDGAHFAESGPIKGSRKSGRIALAIKLKGVASDGSVTRQTRSSFRLARQTIALGLTDYVWDRSVCIQGIGCSTWQMPAPWVVPSFDYGNWSLELDVDAAGAGKLAGDARVELGDGTECSYAVTGKHNAKKDLARLDLAPADPACAGTWLRLKNVRRIPGTPDVLIGSIAYGLFGYAGETAFPTTLDMPRIAPANQQLFEFICNGVLAITADLDPSVCSWSPVVPQ
jgi:hypothetical protein